jgi:hypothetical protein
MRENRRNLPPKKETPLPPIEESVKCKLPPLILDWISVCLREGHIQPSQPSVGRLEGWPMRPYFKNSLYVDFECWCLKAKIPTYLIPSRDLFYQGTDAIFESIACDKYQFPDLAICQENFSKSFKEIKHDQS